jgi:DNA polymerase V
MTIFALVDCNNFYASCERAFNPKLEGKAIVVLSNNDGCVVARSNEAKLLGIRMGEPYFKCKELCIKNDVFAFSSNYELYDDMSSRIMTILKSFCPEIEIYSIDESFLSFSSFNHYNLLEYSKQIRADIKMQTGVPVSIGWAPTKTLAKIANHIAKKQTNDGVFDLCDKRIRKEKLSQFPIDDIWGIGRRLAIRLREFKIETAEELRYADSKLMRREFSVVMERIIAELNGISCLPLERILPNKKEIMSSRSFGKPIMTLSDMEEAISNYCARASYKLRQQNHYAGGIFVFVKTNEFRQDQKQYANAITLRFKVPQNDTRKIIAYAKYGLRKVFKTGFKYKKAGVMLIDLVPDTISQLDIFEGGESSKKNNNEVMILLDSINAKFGKKTLFIGAEGVRNAWQMRREMISQRYTTNWKELPVVFCR